MASYMGSGTARLVTSAEARAAAGEAPATIRIRNLQSVVCVGTDAWGRHGRTQPILVSAEVGLKQTFGAAANSDSVSADTVHYGTLTKAILGFLEEKCGPNVPPNPTAVWTLKCALEGLWARLTGLCIFEILLGGYPNRSQPPVLNATQLRSLAITFHLPKASLAGDGVSLTAMCVYGNRAGVYSMSLCLHNLRQRTLIGVNPNERLAKQVVGTTVEIDKYTLFEDEYTTLENLVVETIEPTAFETLEALATHTAKAVLAGFKGPTGADAWRVKIQMEKPTAITFADCPVIEVVAGPEDLA